MPETGKQIRIAGRVQGVGFRPFAWQLAQETGVSGSVLNDASGVLIEIFGHAVAMETFIRRLATDLPPLAGIDRMEVRELIHEGGAQGFQILPSRNRGAGAGIVPDAATCRNCLEEIRDPSDRRFGYAFANCSNCGPRISIVQAIPYDRASTSMSAFVMCEACRSEYENPADRRFHAQPIACPACGPRLWFETPDGSQFDEDPIALAADRLRTGEILAIKGLGGFQIAVDAGNEAAIAELRRRKHRPHKPLALMAGDCAQVEQHCQVSDEEADLLESAAAPILLLSRKGDRLAGNIAAGQDRLGFMLANTPLHHLLMAKLDGPIVLTSGNRSDNPQEIGNEAARQNLAPIVDGYLMHDREIVNRLDDSVMRLDRSGPAVLRRARGLAPAPIRLPPDFENAGNVLAMGGELKSAICLLDGCDAVLSQHIGDLENAATFADYKKMLELYLQLYQFEPEIIAVDCHPQYLSTAQGEKLAREWGVEIVRVQHHHAHLAACLAEQPDVSRSCPPVRGIILDGLGWGRDGTIWGGEILQAGFSSFERLGHFRPVPLPGGTAAIRQPYRNLAAHLFCVFGPDYRDRLAGLPLEEQFEANQMSVLDQMMRSGLNTPQSTSAGRLFDAVAAAIGICFLRQSYEGEAAMLLESLARPHLSTQKGYKVTVNTRSSLLLSFDDLWCSLIDDLKKNVPKEHIAARFHLGLIDALARAIRLSGGKPPEPVVFSGGVFQNAILRDGLTARLTEGGFTVLNHRFAPANDGGLALGQAVIAAAKGR